MGRRDSRYQRTSSEVRARRYLYQMRPYTEQRCEGKLSCTVLDWRWGGRPPRRPLGKQRPLGIPCFQDTLLQTVVKLMLEAISEPTFSEGSHGFRPQRRCHTARETVKKMTGVRWWIEGDI